VLQNTKTSCGCPISAVFWQKWGFPIRSGHTFAARRGWLGLGTVVFGAAASLLLCYLRTMKKTVEEPDLVPGTRQAHWAPRFVSPVRTALVSFSVRAMTRSRQHRLAFSFYVAVIVCIALSLIHTQISNPALRVVQQDFLAETFLIMSLAVFGMRSVFSLPISLTANWVWRITQLRPSEQYISATRTAVLGLAVIPAWLLCALLSVSLRPWHHVAAHLAVLAVFGWIFAELSLIGMSTVPFTCSYLPGKVHVQVLFWSFMVLLVVFSLASSEVEMPALNNPLQYTSIIIVLIITAVGHYAFNRHRAKSAVIYFEELPPELITSLGLVSGPISMVSSRAGTNAPSKLM